MGRPEGSRNISSQMQRYVCYLDACGKRVKDIETETGVAVQTIYRLRKTQLYMALRLQYIDEINEKGIKQATAALISDATDNVQFLKDIRDGLLDDLEGDVRASRLAASKELLGIQFPKKTESRSDQTQRFVIEDHRRQNMLADCEEAGMPIIPAVPLKRAIEDARAADD